MKDAVIIARGISRDRRRKGRGRYLLSDASKKRAGVAVKNKKVA